VQHRGDAVSSLVYEANARVRDPIYGCVGAISSLQHQVESLQAQLALAQAEMVNLRMRQAAYLAHHLGQETLQDNAYIGFGKGGTVSTDSSAMSSQKLVECDASFKNMYNLDVVVDQAYLDSPMWSC
jgi:DNA-binding transcriptional regulator LsrR (DeoR family)